jgi:hypothetical protein
VEISPPSETSPMAPEGCQNSPESPSRTDTRPDGPEESEESSLESIVEETPTTNGTGRVANGTTAAQTSEPDNWDDYCFVCNQGCDDETGELGCCAGCPHVFHNQCHVPRIHEKMANLPDDWKCTLCTPCEPLNTISTKFGKYEQMLCAKVFLSCFDVHLNVEPFMKEVPRQAFEYYAIIKKPVDFTSIARRINYDTYNNPQEFIDDMNLLFKNCSTFNVPGAPVAEAGKSVYGLYQAAVIKYLPAYRTKVWIYVSLHHERLHIEEEERSNRKRSPALPPSKRNKNRREGT